MCGRTTTEKAVAAGILRVILWVGCTAVLGQNFLTFEHDSVHNFIQNIRTRSLIPQSFLSKVRNQWQLSNNFDPGCNCTRQYPVQSNQPAGPENTGNNNELGTRQQTTTMNRELELGSRMTNPSDGAPTTTQNPPPPQNNAVHQPQRPVSGDSATGFSTNLFQIVGPPNLQRNIIYSPLSLQLLLMFLTLGANGQTAAEMQYVLQLPANNQQISTKAKSLLQKQQNSNYAKLIMANKMYYANNLEPITSINSYAQFLETDLEPIAFSPPIRAAAQMNQWVATKTENRIQNLIQPENLDQQTEAILLNAIYFKAKWAKEFSTSDTEPAKFQNGDGRSVQVNMMYNEEVFNYGEFPNMAAKVIELPYNESDMSMMIILPDDINGLGAVERAMANVDLTQLSQHLQPKMINLRLPRFKYDCELDMAQPLAQLGIKQLFTNNADLSGFFRNRQPKVARVQHKAFLEVNEAGSEAAAASFYKLVPLSLPPRMILFTVDHPFMFAIRSPKAVHFIGHVVTM